jgi:hypothetical protein
MHLILPASASWQTPVMTCSSVEKNGTVPVWEKVRAHQDIVKRSGEFDQRRKSQALEWMWTLVEDGLKRRFHNHEAICRQIPVLSQQVRDEKITPSAAAEKLLSYWYRCLRMSSACIPNKFMVKNCPSRSSPMPERNLGSHEFVLLRKRPLPSVE